MLSLFFFTVSMISFSQNQELGSNYSFKKNQIGVQFNPFIDQNEIPGHLSQKSHKEKFILTIKLLLGFQVFA